MSQLSRLAATRPASPVEAIIVTGGQIAVYACTARKLRKMKQGGVCVVHWKPVAPSAEALNPLPQGFLPDKDIRRITWYKKRGRHGEQQGQRSTF